MTDNIYQFEADFFNDCNCWSGDANGYASGIGNSNDGSYQLWANKIDEKPSFSSESEKIKYEKMTKILDS